MSISVALLLLIYTAYLVFEWFYLSHSGSTYNWVLPFFVFSNPFAASKVVKIINPVMLVDLMAWVFWAVSYVRDER
ncbi:hypothetical protein GI364_21140 [Alicyclobacillus sp. SO9]|nr:hypothetical protein GI364_21140 [Alicyclobacillus sp. SO9]